MRCDEASGAVGFLCFLYVFATDDDVMLLLFLSGSSAAFNHHTTAVVVCCDVSGVKLCSVVAPVFFL